MAPRVWRTLFASLLWSLASFDAPTDAAAWRPKPSGPLRGLEPVDLPPSQHQQLSILWDQTDDPHPDGIVSQNFLDAGGLLDPLDSEAADDFEVPDGFCFLIEQVEVGGGYFVGPGPAVSVNVRFFEDASGRPQSTPSCALEAVVPASGLGSGQFVLDLPQSCGLCQSRYWIVVQANLDFSAGGQWGWTQRVTQSLQASLWRNPGGGFGSPCDDWGERVLECGVGAIDGPDLAFRLRGQVEPLPSIPTQSRTGQAILIALVSVAAVLTLRFSR